MQLSNKAVNSSSYSPVKNNKGFRRTENKFMYKNNTKEDDYKDDDYLWFKTDMNQTQEHISTYSAMTKKNKRQKFIEKSEQEAKSFNLSKNNTRCVWKSCMKNVGQWIRIQTNSRNCNKNAMIITNNPPQFSFKSKMKKRLKFTLRNDKQRQNYLYKRNASKEENLLDINDIVSIVGINTRVQQQSESDDHKIVIKKSDMTINSSNAVAIANGISKRTKSDNRNKKGTYNKSQTSYSPCKVKNLKKNIQTNVKSNADSTEYNMLNVSNMQPSNILRMSAHSDGENSAGLRKCLCQLLTLPYSIFIAKTVKLVNPAYNEQNLSSNVQQTISKNHQYLKDTNINIFFRALGDFKWSKTYANKGIGISHSSYK